MYVMYVCVACICDCVCVRCVWYVMCVCVCVFNNISVGWFFLNIFLDLFIYLSIYLSIYLFIFWLPWVFVAAHGLSVVAANRGYSSFQCTGFSLWWLLLLWSTGSRRAGSVVVVHGLSCSAARGIFLDQGSNPCPLLWQVDS